MIAFNHMKKGELNKLIRERVAIILDRMPVDLKPKERRLVESAIKEVIQSISEEMMRLDNTGLVQQGEELQEIKALWKELNDKLS